MKNRKGFTLVELSVAIFLLAIVFALISTFLVAHKNRLRATEDADARAGLIAAGGSLQTVLTGFVSAQKKGAKWLNTTLSEPKWDKTFAAGVLELTKNAPAASGGFFSRLFGKK